MQQLMWQMDTFGAAHFAQDVSAVVMRLMLTVLMLATTPLIRPRQLEDVTFSTVQFSAVQVLMQVLFAAKLAKRTNVQPMLHKRQQRHSALGTMHHMR